MLNKSQWKSVWFFSIITSVLLSIVIFRNSYIDSEDAFISIIYAIIPVIVIIGATYTLYLKGNNPIKVLPVLIKFYKWILKILTIAIISFAIGFGLKIPIELGSIIYSKYSFNENILKTKYAKDRTWGNGWGSKVLEISNPFLEIRDYGEKKLFFNGVIYNKSELPLTCMYLRILAIDKKNLDTLYDNVIGIDSYYPSASKKEVAWVLPKEFLKLYLLNLKLKPWDEYSADIHIEKALNAGYSPSQIIDRLLSKGIEMKDSKMKIEFIPYGGKISSDYIEKISRSNLKSMLE